ncbi:MAG TPA: hypothetical protein V6D29_16580 [Leptolyngbyaceae cyanobacterium]
MFHFIRHQLHWFSLGIVGISLITTLPTWAGSAPSGTGSGLTTGGSALTVFGAAPIATSGEIALSVAAQESLNAAAIQLLQTLESASPGLVTSLTTPLVVDLNQSVTDVQLAVSGVAIAPSQSLGQLAEVVATAIVTGRPVSLATSEGTLNFSSAQGISSNPCNSAVTVTFTPVDGSAPSISTLRGECTQVSNAAAFLAVAMVSGATPEQVAPFVAIALAGAPYGQVVALLNAISGLLATTAVEGEGNVDPNQLSKAIQAYNAIVASVDNATLSALASNPEFTALGQVLRGLRAAV